MRQFAVECQINANDDRLTVNVMAANNRQACDAAQSAVREQAAHNPNIRGCIVVDIADTDALPLFAS